MIPHQIIRSRTPCAELFLIHDDPKAGSSRLSSLSAFSGGCSTDFSYLQDPDVRLLWKKAYVPIQFMHLRTDDVKKLQIIF